jgi:hypothetical protein
MDKETMSRIRRVEMLLEKMNVDLYPIVISDDAPLFPTSKSIWIDSGDMTLSFQYGFGNSAVWVSFGDLSIQEIIDLADVDPTDIGDGKVLVYNGITGKHEYKVISAKLATLDDVNDANIAIGKTIQVGADGVTHEYVDMPSGGLDKTFQTLTEAATITFDAATSVNGSVILTASRNAANFINPVVGEEHTWRFVQGGTGSYGITWGNQYKASGGVIPGLSATVGAVDLYTFKAISATEFVLTNVIHDYKAIV